MQCASLLCSYGSGPKLLPRRQQRNEVCSTCRVEIWLGYPPSLLSLIKGVTSTSSAPSSGRVTVQETSWETICHPVRLSLHTHRHSLTLSPSFSLQCVQKWWWTVSWSSSTSSSTDHGLLGPHPWDSYWQSRALHSSKKVHIQSEIIDPCYLNLCSDCVH